MIDINCDMGEGINNEHLLMPYISSANIACGVHAGDITTMQQVVQLCLQHKVKIGAHPSFEDRINFGRVVMHLSADAIISLITTQMQLLNDIVVAQGGSLHHVKPHGALYNLAAKDNTVANAIAAAVKNFNSSLVVYGLSGSVMIDEAQRINLATANEVFADRTYQDDGSLTPRTEPKALITDSNTAAAQALQLATQGSVTSISGKTIHLQANTICIHGDGAHAVDFAKALYQKLSGT
jgi:5-oxoprolinase (ATP-hydrolysing) subunit A